MYSNKDSNLISEKEKWKNLLSEKGSLIGSKKKDPYTESGTVKK